MSPAFFSINNSIYYSYTNINWLKDIVYTDEKDVSLIVILN